MIPSNLWPAVKDEHRKFVLDYNIAARAFFGLVNVGSFGRSLGKVLGFADGKSLGTIWDSSCCLTWVSTLKITGWGTRLNRWQLTRFSTWDSTW